MMDHSIDVQKFQKRRVTVFSLLQLKPVLLYLQATREKKFVRKTISQSVLLDSV